MAVLGMVWDGFELRGKFSWMGGSGRFVYCVCRGWEGVACEIFEGVGRYFWSNFFYELLY